MIMPNGDWVGQRDDGTLLVISKKAVKGTLVNEATLHLAHPTNQSKIQTLRTQYGLFSSADDALAMTLDQYLSTIDKTQNNT